MNARTRFIANSGWMKVICTAIAFKGMALCVCISGRNQHYRVSRTQYTTSHRSNHQHFPLNRESNHITLPISTPPKRKITTQVIVISFSL